jgi:hypothetical protein
VHRALTPAALIVEATPAALPADGFTSAEIKLRSSAGGDLPVTPCATFPAWHLGSPVLVFRVDALGA